MAARSSGELAAILAEGGRMLAGAQRGILIDASAPGPGLRGGRRPSFGCGMPGDYPEGLIHWVAKNGKVLVWSKQKTVKVFVAKDRNPR